MVEQISSNKQPLRKINYNLYKSSLKYLIKFDYAF